MVDYSLSVSDLITLDGFKEVFAAGEVDRINLYLFDNGMDIEQPVELVQAVHRNLRNQVVNGQRFEGQERLDEAWIKSGAASFDARIAATEDAHLRAQLRAMLTDPLTKNRR